MSPTLFKKGVFMGVDLKDFVGDGDGDGAATPPAAAQSGALPPEVTAAIARLEESVKATKTQLDDMLAAKQTNEVIARFQTFKAGRGDGFDEAAFFGYIEEKYNEMVKAGATPEQAQETVDRIYTMNPAAWVVIADELGKASAPVTADVDIQDTSGAASVSDDELLNAPNKTNLGKSLMKGNTK